MDTAGDVRSPLGDVRSPLGDVRSPLGDVRSPLGEALSDSAVRNGGDSQARDALCAKVGELWLHLAQQVKFVANEAMANNFINDGHFNTLTARLGRAESNPLEHAAILQLLAAAVKCPCRTGNGPDGVCNKLPCDVHNDWTSTAAGAAAWHAARDSLNLGVGRPHADIIAAWCMNRILRSCDDLKLLHKFVRSKGADVLAAYGEEAFPFGLLTRHDACVTFLSALNSKARDLPLLEQLAAAVATRAASGFLPQSAAAAREALACDLLRETPEMTQRLDVLCSAGLDEAQAKMAAAESREYCHGDAGPGAGKTRTLVARIAHLYRHAGATPHRVVVVTFTRRAVEELKTRVQRAPLPAPRIVTLTSFVPSFLGDVCRAAGEPPPRLVALDRAEVEALAAERSEPASSAKLVETVEAFVLAALPKSDANAKKATEDLAKALAVDVTKAMRRLGVYWHTVDEQAIAAVATATLQQGIRGWFSKPKKLASTIGLLDSLGGNPFPKYTFRDRHVKTLCAIMAAVRESIAKLAEPAPAGALRCPVLTGADAVLLAAALAALARGARPSERRQPPPEWAEAEHVVKAAKTVIQRTFPTFYMLDEMQDTDATQLELFAQLAMFGESDGDARLTTVGDSDQAICTCGVGATAPRCAWLR